MDFSQSYYKYTFLNGNTDVTQIFTGNGLLHGLHIGTTVVGAVKVIDGTSGSTTNVAELRPPSAVQTHLLNVSIGTGLRVALTGSTVVTVIWSQ